MKHPAKSKNPAAPLEVCILAGGSSSRMGTAKARIRIGRKTMLGHVLSTARTLGFPVRTIRRDAVNRCGPLGGIYTALITTSASSVLFLACDMPFVSKTLLLELLTISGNGGAATFTITEEMPGFPLVLPKACAGLAAVQIERREYSLAAFARLANAGLFEPAAAEKGELANLNTPADVTAVEETRKPVRKPK